MLQIICWREHNRWNELVDFFARTHTPTWHPDKRANCTKPHSPHKHLLPPDMTRWFTVTHALFPPLSHRAHVFFFFLFFLKKKKKLRLWTSQLGWIQQAWLSRDQLHSPHFQFLFIEVLSCSECFSDGKCQRLCHLVKAGTIKIWKDAASGLREKPFSCFLYLYSKRHLRTDKLMCHP